MGIHSTHNLNTLITTLNFSHKQQPPNKLINMSDLGRQSYTDKVTSAVKPDSQKSTTEHVGDKVTGTYDRAADALQPQSDKSTTQKAGDHVRGGSDNAKDEGKGVAQTITDSVNSATQSAKDTLNSVTGNK